MSKLTPNISIMVPDSKKKQNPIRRNRINERKSLSAMVLAVSKQIE